MDAHASRLFLVALALEVGAGCSLIAEIRDLAPDTRETSHAEDAHDADILEPDSAETADDIADLDTTPDFQDETSLPEDADGADVADYGPDMVCLTEDLPVDFVVSSDVLIVMDRSGSMALTLNPLKNAVNTVVDASDDRIWFGLMPFPSTVGSNECRMIAPATECSAPETIQVPPGPLRFPEIQTALAGIRTCGSTPTSATLDNVRSCLMSTPTGHTRYVLLVTDGVPNCNSSLDPATCTCLDTESGCAGIPELCLDEAASYAALDALSGAGIATYVMALGSFADGDRVVLNNMAIHGGTEHFYPAEETTSILSTLEEIMETIVVSCTFDLHMGPETDPTLVNLHVREERDVDTLVPRDSGRRNGWDYLDDDTVEFYGPACDTILAGGTVRATHGCPTILI